MTATVKIVLILAAEFVSVLIIMPIAVRLGHFHGFTDKPDNHLKSHAKETPHVGGLVIFAHMAGAMVMYHFLVSALTLIQIMEIALLCLILIIGAIDDRMHLSITIRLGAQMGIAILLIIIGNVFTPTDIQPLNVIITFLLILAMINATNMLDGMDGLAGLVSLFAILGLVYTLVFYRLDVIYVVMGLATITAIIPFLISNFRPNPHKAFLGDSGSTYLGLLMVLLFIKSTNARGESDTVASTVFISIPLFELSFATLIRIWHKKNPLKGSKDHFPLKLKQLTKSETKTVLIISLMALLIFILGIGILHLSTIFKYTVVIIGIILYIYLWARFARIKVD